MSIFGGGRLLALFSGEYICLGCGLLVEFGDEWGIHWCVPAAATA